MNSRDGWLARLQVLLQDLLQDLLLLQVCCRSAAGLQQVCSRFGKNRKDERPGDKMERKGSKKSKSEEPLASEGRELQTSLEQERIQAKSLELREKQARERDYAEIQDVEHTFSSEEEPLYAGIASLNSSMDSSQLESLHNHHYHLPLDPQDPQLSQGGDQTLEALYARVNKPPRNGRPPSADR
ncbi:partitioning defective 3 homolog [Osmerus eperlanus]|uniref:partitioning defective 3 homolog n=1 Tax=Osmerus eperlanus TaxID=29151 RepID=UPI002E109BF7